MSDHLKRLPPPYQMISSHPPDTEIPESPRRSVSLAPSSQCTLSLPSSRALAKRHKQTPARRNHPYDVDHHSKSKASAACAQGASDKSIAWPGGDSLKYAQGVALYPPSRGSSSGVHPPFQTPQANTFQFASGSLKRDSLRPSSPIGSLTTPSANQAQSLPPSLALAVRLAESQPSLASTAPASVPTMSVSVIQAVQDDGSQHERNKLAERLRVYLQTNPEPIIGSPDNPFPSADSLGMRGLPIFSAFFEDTDTDDFACTFCGAIQTDIEAALQHQRVFLQTCVDVEL